MERSKMRYIKKPIVIEAVQLLPNNIKEVYQFIHPEDMFCKPYCSVSSDKWDEYENIVIRKGMDMFTLESGKGTQIASIGDYIIKGVQGEFYPCKPDIFEQTYNKVD